jgi:Right handed beta helix region
LQDVKNVKIKNLTLLGERNYHSGVLGEGGYGVWCENIDSLFIDNLVAKDFWGDGIMLYNCKNVVVTNSTFENNRRNNTSVIWGENITFVNCIFKGANGVSPQSGVDIEPDYSFQQSKNITFDNCLFVNNVNYGLVVQGYSSVRGIVVKNCKFINNKIGFVNNIKDSEASIMSSSFSNNIQYGISTFAGRNNFSDCTLVRNDIGLINKSQNTSIENSRVDSSFQIGIYCASSINIDKCTFLDNNTSKGNSNAHIYVSDATLI